MDSSGVREVPRILNLPTSPTCICSCSLHFVVKNEESSVKEVGILE